MVIWRGWGILAFIGILLAFGLGYGVIGGATTTMVGGIVAAVLLLAAGAGIWFFGRWLNVSRPQQKIEQHLETRAAHYEQLFREGRFQASPGVAVATDPQVAKAQADQLLAEEREQLRSRIRTGHSLFWIPMEWWAAVAGILAIVAFVMGFA